MRSRLSDFLKETFCTPNSHLISTNKLLIMKSFCISYKVLWPFSYWNKDNIIILFSIEVQPLSKENVYFLIIIRTKWFPKRCLFQITIKNIGTDFKFENEPTMLSSKFSKMSQWKIRVIIKTFLCRKNV